MNTRNISASFVRDSSSVLMQSRDRDEYGGGKNICDYVLAVAHEGGRNSSIILFADEDAYNFVIAFDRNYGVE